MAETLDEVRARLQEQLTAEDTLDSAHARLTGQLEASRPIADTMPFYTAIPAQFNRTAARALGLLATPFTAPFLEGVPEGGDTSIYNRIDTALGQSRDLGQRLAERAGFVPEGLGPPTTVAGHVGAELPTAMLMAGASVGAAPRIASAAAGSPGTVSSAIGELAGQIAARPGSAARSIVASEPGMVAARENARPFIEAATPGADEGRLLPTAARAAALFATELVGGIPSERLFRRLMPIRSELAPGVPTPKESIVKDVDPEMAGRIIRTRQVNLIDQTDNAITLALQRAAEPGLTEAVASRRLDGGLLAARDFVAAESKRAYSEVPKDITGNPSGFRDFALDLLARAEQYPAIADTIPVERLRAIVRQLQEGTQALQGTPTIPPTVTPLDATGKPILSRTNPPLTAPQVRYTPGQQGTPGRIAPVWRENIPVQELDEIRSRLIQEARDASELTVTGTNDKRPLKANLDALVDELTRSIEGIGSVDPRYQPALDYARATYRLYNERFMHGPVGELLMTTRHAPRAVEGAAELPGTRKIPAAQVARQMLKTNETADAIAGAVESLGDIQGSTVLRQLIQQRVVNSAEDAVKVMFRKEVMDHFNSLENVAEKPRNIQDIPTQGSTRPGPIRSAVQKANDWVEGHAPLFEKWAKLTADTYSVARRLNRLLEARNEHAINVASQFIGRNAVEVVEEAIRSPNPGARFASLYRQFKNEPTILEGLQRAVVDSVFANRGADPNVALARMRSGNYNDALKAIFQNDPNKFDRLWQMTRDASDILGNAVRSTQSGTATLLPDEARAQMGKLGRGLQTLKENGARIVALAGGHLLLKAIPFMGSAAALSVPMRMGRAGADMVAQAWLADRRQALSFIRDAAFNPTHEAWLRNHAPENFSEANRQYNQLTRYLRRFEATINEPVHNLVVGYGDQLYQEDQKRARRAQALMRAAPSGRP